MTWLFQSAVCDMRKSSAPASRSSCKASPLLGVLPLVGGPGEKPIGKTLRPLRTRTLSALTVTTEPVWATTVIAASTIPKQATSREAVGERNPWNVEQLLTGRGFIMRSLSEARSFPKRKTKACALQDARKFHRLNDGPKT